MLVQVKLYLKIPQCEVILPVNFIIDVMIALTLFPLARDEEL